MGKKEFINQEFEGENDNVFTFIGRAGYFCIILNGKCIHSVKTEKFHLKKLNSLISERKLTKIS